MGRPTYSTRKPRGEMANPTTRQDSNPMMWVYEPHHMTRKPRLQKMKRWPKVIIKILLLIKCLLHTGHCATNTLRICHHWVHRLYEDNSYTYFLKEGIENQRGWVASPESHSYKATVLGIKTSVSCVQSSDPPFHYPASQISCFSSLQLSNLRKALCLICFWVPPNLPGTWHKSVLREDYGA